MKTNSARLWLATMVWLFASAALAQQGQLATPLSNARITVENRADADGYIRIRLTPTGGATLTATVDVLGRMSENEIAADIEKALTVALGDAFDVDRSGGENVSIRKTDRDAPDFVLEIAFNTPGLSITMHD